jgi:chorismate synthase
MLTVVVDGVPAGLTLSTSDLDEDLRRRQRGYGRGGRMKIESDTAQITAGVRGGLTLGSPIVLTITNRDFESWRGRMGAEPFEVAPEPLVRPRPGHADLAGGQTFAHADLRTVLERASARETAARVAAGAIARRYLAELGVEVFAHVTSIGSVAVPSDATRPAPTEALRDAARASEMACADPDAEARMKEEIHAASHAGDTLGGTFEVVALGVPPGFGSHTQWDAKLDGRLAGALMSIPAIKGVEIGLGFEAARLRGSAVHDPIAYDAEARRYRRTTNGAGGLEGGISNGEPVVCRVAMKPISTLRKALASVDILTRAPVEAAFERSDVCAVPAASVIGEAMVLLVLADAFREKLGGDSMGEVRRNLDGYLAALESWPDPPASGRAGPA